MLPRKLYTVSTRLSTTLRILANTFTIFELLQHFINVMLDSRDLTETNNFNFRDSIAFIDNCIYTMYTTRTFIIIILNGLSNFCEYSTVSRIKKNCKSF